MNLVFHNIGYWESAVHGQQSAVGDIGYLVNELLSYWKLVTGD